MQVLFVDDSAFVGGGALSLVRYLEQPSRFGRSALFLRGGPLSRRALRTDVPTVVLDRTGGRWSLLLSWLALRRELTTTSADVVVCNSMRTAILMAFLDKRRKTFILYCREDLSRRSLSWPRRMFLRFGVLPRFDAYISNSEWTQSVLSESLRQHRPNDVAYPLSGMTATSPLPKRHKTREDTVELLSLSRLVEWKGVHVLLEALGKLHAGGHGGDFHLTIAGGADLSSSNYAHRIRTALARLGDAVTVVGEVDDVSNLVQAADALVLCSIAPEPFGQVLVQASVAGIYVIATEPGGAAEVLRDYPATSILPMGDSNALANTLLELRNCGNESRATADDQAHQLSRFADETVSEHLDSVIAALTDRVSQRHSSCRHHEAKEPIQCSVSGDTLQYQNAPDGTQPKP